MLKAAQERWAAHPLAYRLGRLAALRRALARQPEPVLQALASSRPQAGAAELVSSELLPLLDACRFLEREAARWLAPRRLGSQGQPLWLRGVDLEIHRDPLGVVLVIGPANYPLFLPGCHCLQALAAGNAVLWKPAPGCRPVALEVARAWSEAGGEDELRILSEDPAEAASLIEWGEVDKIILTGSRATGEAVLRQAAGRIVPVVAELSGCDLMWVGAGADLERAARALAFGLRLNQGRTCLAPRRVLVERPVWTAFRELARIRADGPVRAQAPCQAELDEARQAGGSLLRESPWLLEFPALPEPPLPALLSSGVFGPVAALVPVDEPAAALRWLNHSPCALGAALFGEEQAMLRLARRVTAGVVTINDLIAPTADPRLPFGGRRESGFGSTRGGEGLLEMTAPRAIQIRRRGWLRHLDPPRPPDGEILKGYLQLAHGGGWSRLAGLTRLVRGVFRYGKDRA